MIRNTVWKTVAIVGPLLIAALCAGPAGALDNGLARTPPMGWNTWNKFQCNVSEQLVKEMANAMVSSGMKDAGYQYVIIDDCWQKSRDAQGNIEPDPQHFPSGMKALADYVHARGLKFGLYSDAGTATCQGRPGGKGYEEQDAKQYAAWGIDYLKYDWCNTTGQTAQDAYATMSQALQKAGRPVVFSICEWGMSKPWTWAKDVGHLWRTTGDISDKWSSTGMSFGPDFDPSKAFANGVPAGGPPANAGPPPGTAAGGPPAGGFGPGSPGGAPPFGIPAGAQFPGMGLGFLQILDKQAELADYAGPGHWNDPDMLEVGNGGMTDEEYRAHFSLWAMIAAPLIAGNDLRSMTPATKEILTNKEVIAVNQDKLGKAARRVKRVGDIDVWSKELADGARAVTLLNRGEASTDISVNWADIGLPAGSAREVRDLWTHKSLGKQKDKIAASVPRHSAVVLRIARR